jgi:hypothetical protein
MRLEFLDGYRMFIQASGSKLKVATKDEICFLPLESRLACDYLIKRTQGR